MTPRYILAHDIGTTGDKAALYNSSGDMIASSFSAYETYYPHINWAEQDPNDWWEAFCNSTKRLIKEAKIFPGDIECISFSGQMMGCLPIDKDGVPLRRSIIWADQRSIKQAELIGKLISEERVYRITGHRISPTYSAAKILWIKENHPDIFSKTYKFLHAKDYIVHHLTGEFLTDYSDASSMNLFDITKLEWSEEILEALGIPLEKLPELHSSIDIVGEVTEKAALESGLEKGTLVVMGGGDGPCAAVGAGVVREGSAYCYIGSSSWIALATPKPIYDPDRRTFNFYHLHPRLVTPTGTMQSAGGSYQWLKRNICLSETKAAEEAGVDPYEIMNLKAEMVEAGSDNLLFLPYLMGERSPHWNPYARGVFLGLTQTHRREHIIRSVLEGVTFNLRIILEAFQRQGADIKSIKVIGGGAKGRLWRQIMADIFDKPIARPALLEEATSLGAAIAGGIGVGIFEDFSIAEQLVKIIEVQVPNPAVRDRYDELYRIFVEAYEVLVPIYDKLAKFER